MSYKLVLTDRAVIDIHQGRDWYDSKSNGLGARFSDQIFNSIDIIQNNPFSFPCKYRFTREKVVKIFPYVIVYSVEGKVIFILRIFPCKQDPLSKYSHPTDPSTALHEPEVPYKRKKSRSR